jgi:glycosyltransferase involved in cell wall biosynthesis
MTSSVRNKRLKVLILEPYFGGSHRSFLENISRLNFDFELITLPARKWKWRMRLAAPYFAEILHQSGKRYDRILCSTFVDVAAFRGMAPSWVREVPLLTYFHENQFVYPVQVEDERDFHFALTNMTTALCSDSIAFNSEYNLSAFINGIDELLKISPDMRLEDPCALIKAKSKVIPPGIDFTDIDVAADEPERDDIPVILWNHRWEHDKGPEEFFRTLYELDDEGIDFRLVVLGESFQRRPEVFDEARERLSHRILQFGYVRSRQEYAGWMKRCDIAVSTSTHEFFGISVVEAVRAGCRPLLPKRLSYPELFTEEFLYNDDEFRKRLKEILQNCKRLSSDEAKRLTEPYSWDTLAPVFEEWIGRGAEY